MKTAETTHEVALVLGFPRLLARGLVIRGLNLHPETQIFILVKPDDASAAARFLEDLGPEDAARVTVLNGHPRHVDLGLPGITIQRLMNEVTQVFHGGTADESTMRQPLIKGMLSGISRMLDLAGEMKRLKRYCFVSTAFVSGDRGGVILEDELEQGQHFHTPFARAMFSAERLLRAAMPRLPITVLRPAAMIGHSRTGESSGLCVGPNYLLKLMVRLPTEIPFLLPGLGVVPFNIVPIDYVVRAAWVLAQTPEARGRAFHLTDPNPVSARRAFQLLAELADRPAPLTGGGGLKLAQMAFKWSGLARLAPNQAALLQNLTTHVTYSCAGTLEVLSGTDVVCPPFESYADALINWIAQYERTRRQSRKAI